MFLSLIASVILLIVFLPKRKELQYKGFLKSAYNFLNFNTFWISPIIKLLYMTVAFTLVIGGFIVLFIQPLMGLMLLICGIFIRLLFETGYILYSIFDQLSQMNRKMGPGGLTAAADAAAAAQPQVFCPQCGKAKEPSEMFCQKCGYKY